MRSFKAGQIISQGSYKSFIPAEINRQWYVDNPELQELLSQADRHLGRLDMFSEYVNIDLFIQMHVLKEATQSSRIEGTRTNVEEALLEKEDIDPEKRDDWEEVQNYVLAMKHMIARLEDLPFSTRIIKEGHAILLQGVRGHHKLPGEFRRSQNWIGGASIKDAVFVPPTHHRVDELMSDLEKFIHNDEIHIPELIRIALIHYQFETIHPFLDGNGRLGRLMITMYLVSKDILKSPILYLSDFFERNRTLYYDNLMKVRMNNDLDQWMKFFLVGIIETAKKGVDTFNKILQLKNEVEGKIQVLGTRTASAMKVIQSLFAKPITDGRTVAKIAGISPASSYKLINDLVKMNILVEISGAKRGRIYAFESYLQLFKG